MKKSILIFCLSIFYQIYGQAPKDTLYTLEGKAIAGEYVQIDQKSIFFKIDGSKNVSTLPKDKIDKVLLKSGEAILIAQFGRNSLILKRELILNSHVIGQEKQDVLKLTNGSTYNGEFVKIESGNVLFKSEGAIGPQRIKINEIKMLKLSNGTEIINWGKIKRKAKEIITIQLGDKIMVTYDTVSKSVTGLFYGFDNGEISIQRFDQNQKEFYTIIPANLVANIIVLPIHSAESAPAVAISCGIIMIVLSSLDGFDAEVGLVMGGLGAITGAIGGSVLNAIKNQRAYNDSNKYTLLGKDAWYIDNHDIK